MAMPPNMFEHPEAFTQPEVEYAEAVEAEEANHHHGPDCGHEAIEHDDHIDYVVGGKRHWWNHDRWEDH